MPVIVIGADTAFGRAVAGQLLERRGEVRVFVTDATTGTEFKERGAKVAIGDVSDASHVGGAALNTFSAVLVTSAAVDERERSFAANEQDVFAAWAEAVEAAGVRRVIWVVDGKAEPVDLSAPEVVTVDAADRTIDDVAAQVALLDEAASV